jgi:hypothetical protein
MSRKPSRRSRLATARRRALVVAVSTAATVLHGATVAAPAAHADPVPPTAVSLTTTKATLGSQDSATLTATANGDVANTGKYIRLYDATTSTLLNVCSSGLSCSISRSFTALGNVAHDYVAYVASSSTSTFPPEGITATSNIVTLTPVPWSVTLTSTKSSLGSQDTATLTATANQDVANTGKYIRLYDATTSTLLNVCSSGLSCSISRGFTALGNVAHDYVAYVAASSTSTFPPAGIVATSNTLTLTPVPWSVTLTSTKTTLGSQDTATLTATANQDVANSGKYIRLYDATTSTLLTVCSSGLSCSISRGFTALGNVAHDYVAYVAASSTSTFPPGGIVATSNTLTLTPVAWSLTLTSTITSVGSQQSATLTATANQDVANTGKYIRLYDATTSTLLTVCSSGLSCSISRSFSHLANTPHDYVAYVANSSTTTFPPAGIVATSNTLTLAPVAWSVTLTADRTALGSQDTATLTATINQDVSGTGKDIRIYDVTTSTLLWSCSYGVSCAITRSYYALNGTAHQFVAYVATSGSTGFPPPGIVGTSNTVTVAPSPLVLTLTTDRSETTDANPSALLSASLSYPVPSGYSFSVYDETGYLYYCSSLALSTFQVSVTPPADTSRVYTAYVSQSCPASGTAGGAIAAEDSVGVTRSNPGGAVVSLGVTTWQPDPATGHVTYAMAATGSRLAAPDGPCASTSCTWLVGGYAADPVTGQPTLVQTLGTGSLSAGSMDLATTLDATDASLAAFDTVELAVYGGDVFLSSATAVGGVIAAGVSVEEFTAFMVARGVTEETLCAEVASAPQPRPSSSVGTFGEACLSGSTLRDALLAVVAVAGGAAVVYWVWTHYHTDTTQPPPAPPAEPPTTSQPSATVVEPQVEPALEPLVQRVVSTWLEHKRVRAATSVVTLKRAAADCLDMVARSVPLARLWADSGEDPCETLPIYFPGNDLGDALTHRSDAVYTENPDWMYQTYESRAVKKQFVSTTWYAGEPECAGRQTGQNCDEFPNFSSVKGGPAKPAKPRAGLRLISGTDNQREGSRYGGFVTSCGLTSAMNDTGAGGGSEFLVVPVTFTPTWWLCPITIP